MTVAVKLTPARRRGLEVLACANRHIARISNFTDARRNAIYWQTARWLLISGLAARRESGTERWIELTPAGAELCRDEGLL